MATDSSDISLLFRIRADAAGVKTGTAEAKAAVAQLRQSFGPELAASVSVGQKALQSLGGSVENLVSQRLPLLGSVVVSVSNGLRQIGAAAGESKGSVDGVGLSFAEIGAITHRTEAQVAGFVTSLGLLGTEAARNTAVVGFLGGALASSLRPQLDDAAKAGLELNRVFQASGKSTDEALRLVQALGLIGDATQRSAAAVTFFGEATARKLLPQLERFGASLGVIAAASGRSGAETAEFIARFARLGTEVEKRTAAVEFFGASLATKLGPELAKTSAALGGVSTASAAAGTSIAAIAGPVGIAVLAVAALAAGAVIAGKQIFDLTKNVAAFQGHMGDLAQQTGLAVETLSALEVLAKRTGGNLDTITQATVLFQRKLDDAQDPLSKTAELFRKFNIDTSDTETSLRSAFNALAAMPQGFAQTNAAAELFGARGGKQILAILKETNGNIDDTIDRMRELGILISDDAARAADKFNDDLALLEFQLRGLTAVAVRDLIPALAEIIRNFGELLEAIRPVVKILGTLAGVAIRPVVSFFQGLSFAVLALTGDLVGLEKALKAVRDAREIPPVKVTEPTPVPLPGAPSPQQAASEVVNQADAVLAAVRRKAAETNQALSESFQKGRIDREKEATATIATNARLLRAETERIDAQLAQRELELKALDEAQRKRGEIINRDTDAYRAVTAAIGKLQQERLDKENLFNVTSREIRARAAQERADAIRNQIQNETNITIKEFDRQIKNIEAQIERGVTVEEDGLTIIEQIEQEKINVRAQGLDQQKEVGFLTVEAQREIDEEIKKLNQERDQLTDEQNNRRLARERAAGQRAVEIAIANIDTLIQLEQIAGQRRIDTIQALADQRAISDEQAARQILQIRLDLIDDEIEATQTKLKAAASIADKDERIRTQADLNNQLKILNEQRKSIQSEGNRAIEDGRRKDLENERRYADELEDIYERIRRIERDAAEEVIRLMIAGFARRKDIIRAQRDLDLAEEDDRHRRVTESIRQQKAEIDAEIRLLTQRLERLKVGTAEEIEEHDRLVASLEKLRAARAALDDQQKVEDDRTKTRKRRVTTDADRDEEEADPLGRLELDTERLQEFARTLEDTIVPLNEILAGSFRQVADAIGQTVANWVLLGETGPGVMRKILAQALASLAAEAAVNAIKELALGFATLFFNPAESAAHFTAAGLWASIGGVAAIAGRGIAGDLFKQKSGASSGGSSDGRSGELNPLSLARNAGPGSQQIAPQIQPIRIEFAVNDSRFGKAITAHVVEDFSNAGPIREVIAGDGNLNRG